jgi:hypothetical protein
MRRLLVDHARAKKAAKRDGGRVELSSDPVAPPDRNEDLDALDAALERLPLLVRTSTRHGILPLKNAVKLPCSTRRRTTGRLR